MCNVLTRKMSMEHVFNVKAMVCGYHEYWDAPIEILSCEREVGNIHDTFSISITKDCKAACCCYFSSFHSNF